MGAFFGVVYLRTQDREPVRELLEDMARKKKTHFLLAPVLRGWLGIYPQQHGQDERISRSLAKRVSCDLLHVLVHDDDIFCYFLYQAGRLVDQFNSQPDYFGGHVSKREREKLKGNPARFAHLLTEPADLPKLKALLATPESDQPIFAQETLDTFAKLLDLPNALTSYEHLWQGETDEIEGWDDFVHIPQSEIARQEAARAALDAEEQRCMDAGLLLFQQAGKGQNLDVERPFMCSARKGSAFWASWASGMTRDNRPLQRYAPPWSAGPEPTGIELPSTEFYLQPSRSGRYLAAGHASGNWKAQCWDVTHRRLLVEHIHRSAVQWADFTADEKTFVSRSGDEVIRTDLGDLTSQRTYPVAGHGRSAALHPAGDFLVVDMQLYLGLLDLRSGELHSPLCLGTRLDESRIHAAFTTQVRSQLAGMDFEAIVARVEKTLRASGLADDSVRDNVRAQIEAMKKRLAEAGSPRQAAPLAIRGSERPSAMEFHPSGNQLFCATSAGCRVYDWNAVRDSALSGSQQMPAPVFAASSTPASHPMHRRMVHTEAYVYALAFDARAERLLFGGLAGCVDYLDLRSGLSGTLLELPGRPVVLQLCLNEDGTALACCVQPDFFEQGKRRRPPKLQIWDYRALAEKLPSLRLRQ